MTNYSYTLRLGIYATMMAIKVVKCAKCKRLIAFAHFQLICAKSWEFIWNSLELAEIKNVVRAFCGMTPITYSMNLSDTWLI